MQSGNRKMKVLIVDDSEINRSLLADILSPEYSILEACNGVEAVSILRDKCSEIALVLLDIVMPEMDGFEVLAVMNRNRWIQFIPVLMISAEVSSTYVDHAYDLGATDYITRPFDEKTIIRRVKNSITVYSKQKYLEDLVTEQILEKERTNFQMVEILSNIVEFRNGESGMHVLHVRAITDMLLQNLRWKVPEYHLTASRIALIANASTLHDVGKISIPEAILNKPGKLTREEFEVMKTHTVIGAQILENAPNHAESDLLQLARDICRWHHERFDGRGYPDGLKGDEIPIWAQVVSMADVYDALISPRVYKPGYSHQKSMQMIRNGECGAFSPLLLDCLLEIGPRLEKELDTLSPQAASSMELRSVASELMESGELHISSRTVTLLEQERAKYRFYASMTKEILIDYDVSSDLLEISEWGANYLGLPELIQHPAQNEALLQIGQDVNAYLDMKERLAETSLGMPLATCTYCLMVKGVPHWFKVIVRTMWDSEEATSYSRVFGKLMDVHEEQMKINELQAQVDRDTLTVLLNRKAAREQIGRLLEEAEGKSGMFIMLDLDNFKAANDKYGHAFGDSVLKYVAQCIRHSIRHEDVAARVGGDEFLIYVDCCESAEELAKRIFHAVNGIYQDFQISASMGIALYPTDGRDYETLFHRADMTLYAAKEGGKKRYLFYTEDTPAFAPSRTPIDS